MAKAWKLIENKLVGWGGIIIIIILFDILGQLFLTLCDQTTISQMDDVRKPKKSDVML